MSNTTAAAPHIAAILQTHKRLLGLQSLWVALALCMSAVLAPQAFAAACGPAPAITLTANQWRMVGIPCVPTGILTPFTATVGNVFVGVPTLTAAKYYNSTTNPTGTWVAWKRIYTTTVDSYTRLAATDLVTTGDALWIYTTVGGTLRVNGTTTAGSSFTTPIFANQASGTNRYIMYANPYASNPATDPLNYSALLFSGILFGFLPTGDATTADAVSDGYISAEVSYWNGTNTYYTRSLTSSPVATFAPNEAAWIKVFPAVPAAGITNTKIKAPQP